MQNKKWIFLYALLLGTALTSVQAQVSQPDIGSKAIGTGGTISYSTTGQIVYTTTIGISAGNVQSGLFMDAAKNKQQNSKIVKFTIFPNPTTDYLNIKIEGELSGQNMVSLFDMNGKLLLSANIEGRELKVDIHNLQPANYLLKLINDNKELKSFEIVKK